MSKAKDQIRVFFGADGQVEESLSGRHFFDQHLARFTDLSGVRLLRCGVDTVRQLYAGLLRPDFLSLFGDNPGMVDFAGYRFHASRVGRDSGYQFKLQNADLGLILLIKNFNVKIDVIGPHLKIEVSPHAIDAHEPDRLQAVMDRLASECMSAVEPKQCAVHLALDFQGWTPPDDITARLHCKATAQRRFDGINSFEWADKSATYGRGQSYMFGSAGACQLGIYNKTLQARAIDKLDWWESVWRRRDNPFDSDDAGNYDPDQPVWRCELRYHHSVVNQFAAGSCSMESGQFIETRTFAEFAPHLDGLWRYGLTNFRLLARPGLLDAFWQLIRDDVRVETGVTSLVDKTEYKRKYKTAAGFSGKNIDLMIGNAISLAARQGLDAKKTYKALKSLPFWPLVRIYYRDKGMTPQDIRAMVGERLEERIVRWGRAV
jgi:hypothetical protein